MRLPEGNNERLFKGRLGSNNAEEPIRGKCAAAERRCRHFLTGNNSG